MWSRWCVGYVVHAAGEEWRVFYPPEQLVCYFGTPQARGTVVTQNLNHVVWAWAHLSDAEEYRIVREFRLGA